MILTALALLSGPCGIDSVIPSRGGGVAISFSYADRGQIRRNGRHHRVRLGRTRVHLRTGDELLIYNIHDGCVMTVKIKDGQLGVEAASWRTHPSSEATDFVPAQRR